MGLQCHLDRQECLNKSTLRGVPVGAEFLPSFPDVFLTTAAEIGAVFFSGCVEYVEKRQRPESRGK
jgi:hypothetical protein